MSEKYPGRAEGDVVLICYQDSPAAYARIEAIEPDIKKGWYLVTLLLLTLPSQTVTWILRDEYINGKPFTMGGRPVRLEAVKRVVPQRERDEKDESSEKPATERPARVIPFKKQS
ncbi:MAG: hypothetical protein ACOWYE_18330 [Desulfatiglandales bacterium]